MVNGVFLKEGDVIPPLSDFGFGVVRLMNGLKIRDHLPVDDQQVTANRTAMANAGLPHWGYVEYNYDESVTGWASYSAYKVALEFVNQSKKGLSKISGLIVGLVEVAGPDGKIVPLPAAGTLKANLENWSKVILQETGKKPLLYSNPSMLVKIGSMVGVETMRLFNLAIAHYNVPQPNTVYWDEHCFWDSGIPQTSTHVSGIWSFPGTSPELASFASTGVLKISEPVQPTDPNPPVDPTPLPGDGGETPTEPQVPSTLEERLTAVENRLKKYDALFKAISDLM